ncbi:MAG: VPS10 domain-containing protein [Pyrinomonadaceae bacterium]
MPTRNPLVILCLLLALVLVTAGLSSAQQNSAPTAQATPLEQAQSGKEQSKSPVERAFERLEWRSIGPANMGGRIADVEGVPGDPNLVYVASASGGLWKTTNGGVTWKPIFERQGTISIGDIALAPGNPDVVWVGTGESNPRNSVSFGDGVYKSTDGGLTWQNMGLRDSHHIAAIAIHPQNPDVVYVGALGHAFGPNDERGVFMTTDGGRTWTRTLFIDNAHGVSDLDIDPTNPNILYAGMWSFERKAWTHRSGSEKGGVFKSIDGGRTWKKLTNGLPKLIGRIGVRVAPSNPNVVYAIMEAKEGTLYRSDDRGETFKQVSQDSRIVSRGFYYTTIRVNPLNENHVYAVASTLYVSIDGGKSFRSITGRTHIDYHALWLDPKNPKRIWQGQDGGVAVSQDGGEAWEYVNNIPLGQFYQIHADNRLPFYYVMGGLQDNGTWTGPSRTREPAGIMNDDWRMISFGDGFYVINHPDDPERYLSESQGGNILHTDFRTREQQAVNPAGRGSGGGPATGQKYRFNWNAPIIASPHDKQTVYLGGNVIFKSPDFGKTWEPISPDLTTNDPEKQKDAGGPIAIENSTAEYHTTIISLAESPVQRGQLWAGTDDGNLQLSNDGGKNWANLVGSVSGLGANSAVSHIEPSRTSARVAYVAFDRHTLDDFRPYVFKTSDGGKTWQNISGNLPAKAYVQVVREDPKNASLLYAGTEIGLFVSYSGGADWVPLNLKNLPHVAIHDIVIHPRENDLILGTHGRSIWILDDATPVQQMTPQILNGDAHLFPIRPALRFTTRFTRYGIGDKVFTGPNPPYGALISYYLKDKLDDKTTFSIQILDRTGKLVQEIDKPAKEQGLNRVTWNLRFGGAEVRRPPSEEETAFTGPPRGPQVLPGTYTVKVTIGPKTLEERVEVRLDPAINVPPADLQAQLDLTQTLRDMQSAANTALRYLDSIKDQLKHTQTTVKTLNKEPDKELIKALEDYVKQVETLQDRVARRTEGLGLGGSAQVADRVGGLFFALEGTNAAPTPYQRQYFEEFRPEFRARMEEVNKFIRDTVPQWNENLRAGNAPTLATRKPVEF